MKMLWRIFTFATILFPSVNLWAIPAGFNIQGRLTDAKGVNRPENSLSITFSIYDTPTGGTAIWSVTRNAKLQNGNFQEELGGADLNDVDLEGAVRNLQDAYVEITVGGEPALVPRQRLLRSPFPSTNMVGAVMFFAGRTCPEGWLLANGAVLPISETFKPLSDYLQDAYGEMGKLPNMRDGAFLRGTGGNADSVGVKQNDELRSHNHSGGAYSGTLHRDYGGGVTIGYAGVNTGDTGGVETRPINYAMTPCIKY